MLLVVSAFQREYDHDGHVGDVYSDGEYTLGEDDHAPVALRRLLRVQIVRFGHLRQDRPQSADLRLSWHQSFAEPSGKRTWRRHR